MEQKNQEQVANDYKQLYQSKQRFNPSNLAKQENNSRFINFKLLEQEEYQKYLPFNQHNQSVFDNFDDLQLEGNQNSIIPISRLQTNPSESFFTLGNDISFMPSTQNQPKEEQNQNFQTASIDKEKIMKQAKKNALQFFSGLILDCASESKHRITREEFDMIEKLKQKPNIKNFDSLFKRRGKIRLFLGEFFSGKKLWYNIMNSKVRHYLYKSVYKNTISILKNGFIRSHLSRLSFSKSANGKDTDILSQQ